VILNQPRSVARCRQIGLERLGTPSSTRLFSVKRPATSLVTRCGETTERTTLIDLAETGDRPFVCISRPSLRGPRVTFPEQPLLEGGNPAHDRTAARKLVTHSSRAAVLMMRALRSGST
jgi:hypothetical protein